MPKPVTEPIIYDEKADVFHRKGTRDLNLLKYKRPWYSKVPLLETDTVLEIGAFTGFFTRYCCPRVHKIYAYEPVLESYEVLLANVEPFMNVNTVQKAVVNDPALKNLALYFNPKTQYHGSISGFVKRGRVEIEVPCSYFYTVLKVTKPTVLSLDCEGGEYSLLAEPNRLPKSIRIIDLEIHKLGFDQGQACDLIATLRKKYKPLILPAMDFKKDTFKPSYKTLWERK